MAPSSRRSSKKSSRRSLSKPVDNTQYATIPASSTSKPVDTCSSLVVAIIIQGAILYYLYNLEGADCNCIRDWRHNFIKGMSIINILSSLLLCLQVGTKIIKQLTVIIGIASLINFYAFFTYVGDLNETKCICAVNKQPTLNKMMNILRWLPFFALGMAILLLILLIIMGVSVMKSIKS